MMDPVNEHSPTQLATLGGGCFWCLEAVYKMIPGVRSVVSGYAGGKEPNPSYRAVCAGATGHAEVVQVEFDPAEITFEELLEHFWEMHDPTTLNRQGNDVGTQYRSAIFYADDTQRAIAEASKARTQERLKKPVVTEIAPLEKFWPGEDYHQDYFEQNPGNPYCKVVVLPKVEKFRHKLAQS